MKNLKAFLSVMLVAVMCLSLMAGCGNAAPAATEAPASAAPAETTAPVQEKKDPVTIGSSGLGLDVAEVIAKLMADKGFEVKVVPFDSNSGGADLCSAGDLDSFLYNRRQWIDQYNIDNKTDLVMVNDLYYTRQALYSKKYTSLDQLPDGALICIPNDATNMNGTLLFLQETGLIKLGETTEALFTILDIAENPKNIKFMEAEVSYVAISAEDCDAFVCPAKQAASVGVDPNVFLAEDMSMKDYPVGLGVRGEDANSDWVAAMLEVFATEEFKEGFNGVYGGYYVLY